MINTTRRAEHLTAHAYISDDLPFRVSSFSITLKKHKTSYSIISSAKNSKLQENSAKLAKIVHSCGIMKGILLFEHIFRTKVFGVPTPRTRNKFGTHCLFMSWVHFSGYPTFRGYVRTTILPCLVKFICFLQSIKEINQRKFFKEANKVKTRKMCCRKETVRCRSCSFQFKVCRHHSVRLTLARLQSSKRTGVKQNLTQNGHSRSRVLGSVERR